MTKEQKFLIQSITERIVGYLMRDRNISIVEAFKTIFQSPKYPLLMDVGTGLYIQSPLYVYNFIFN